MKLREEKKRAIFSTFLLGGGGGGGQGFSFILSKIAILDKIKWNRKPPFPSPQIKDEAARRAKTRHFPTFDWGGGGSRFSIYFIQDCNLGQISFAKCLFSNIDDLAENMGVFARCPRMPNVLLRLTCVSQKRPCLSSVGPWEF